MLSVRKQRLLYKQTKQSKRCGSLSQLCVVLLFILVIFYVTVASYLIPGSAKYQHQYDDIKDPGFVQLIPLAPPPKFDSYQIPNIPSNKHEDKNYAPPDYDAKQQEIYLKLNDIHDDMNDDIHDDIDDIDDMEEKYRSKCPEKFPKKVPEMNEFPVICSHLNDFDVRFWKSCTLETCDECIPPNSKRMRMENEQASSWQKRFSSTLNDRRKLIKSMIGHIRPKLDGPIILMVFNYGYSWLFYNLLCSLEYNDIDIRNRTIIVTTDLLSKELVLKTGFMAHYPSWLGSSILDRITTKAAASFALGAHKWIVSIQIALITDLIHMGHDVIMQDIDLIWYKSPIPYLQKRIYENIDIQMSVDGTMGLRGPGNSGFFIVRSNCKMKLFMDTMVSLIGLIMTGRSDQMLWNTLLQEKHFRMINFQTLTTKHFISGFQVNLAHKTKRSNLNENHFIVHASWTTDQWDKIEKFYMIDHWYFTKEKCPKWYNFDYLPDLAERKWHIRDKTQEQELKFKKLGLFRDSTNGSYVKHS